ncbi:TolC family protein [Chitinispirillales bacterium ANBcel5]|uniref:TolC family protein n=1 Tax=Cellulosispirillum alkaliphilum TaxID=3039283 RepID=UPI002A4E4724|nr:TolC family protein [Chitinispirillales bacterium ANBcel5]
MLLFVPVVIAFFTFTIYAEGLSENDVLLKALSNNTDIRIHNLESQTDSLKLREVSSKRLPQVSLRGSGSLDDSISSANASATVSQTIPGGGTVFGTVEQSGGIQRSTSRSTSDRRYVAGVEQPLLRNAWSNSPVELGIQITTINNELLSIGRRQRILSTLSDVRNLYWNAFERKELQRIQENQVTLTEEFMKSERERFVIGEASALDTLSAALQYANAKRNMLRIENESQSSLYRLAAALGVDASEVTISQQQDVLIPDIGDPDELIDKALKYDPQVKIFERMQELTSLRIKQRRNDLLPELNLRASYDYNPQPSQIPPLQPSGSGASIGFVLNYSLPSVSTRSQIEQQELSLKSEELSFEQHRLEQRYFLKELRDKWQQDKEMLHYSNLSVDLAYKQYEATKRGYELGTEDRLSLIKAQNDLVAAEVTAIQAIIDLKRLQIVIEEITGTLFDRFGVYINES